MLVSFSLINIDKSILAYIRYIITFVDRNWTCFVVIVNQNTNIKLDS